MTEAKDFTIIAIRRSSTRNELSDCIHQFWTRANQDELSELVIQAKDFTITAKDFVDVAIDFRTVCSLGSRSFPLLWKAELC